MHWWPTAPGVQCMIVSNSQPKKPEPDIKNATNQIEKSNHTIPPDTPKMTHAPRPLPLPERCKKSQENVTSKKGPKSRLRRAAVNPSGCVPNVWKTLLAVSCIWCVSCNLHLHVDKFAHWLAPFVESARFLDSICGLFLANSVYLLRLVLFE